MKTVCIYGTGLIGGSFALALRRAFPSIHITGVDRPEIAARAKSLNIINETGPAPADLTVLATPVGDILKLLDRFTSEQCLVTDVGSTKVAICHRAERLNVPFVGGHPMAGIEQSGPEAASADLFKGSPYFLCPVKSTPDHALREMENIAGAVGAVPHVISPEDHDRLVAQISHLPQVISTVLAGHTSSHKEMAGPGLRSMTRLANSPLHVWRDIFKTSGYLPRELQSFIERLQQILDSIEAGNFDEIESLFKREGHQ